MSRLSASVAPWIIRNRKSRVCTSPRYEPNSEITRFPAQSRELNHAHSGPEVPFLTPLWLAFRVVLWNGVSPKAGFAVHWCPCARGQMFLARPSRGSGVLSAEAKPRGTCFPPPRHQATCPTRSVHRRLTRFAAREGAGGSPRPVQGRLSDGVHHCRYDRFRFHTSRCRRARLSGPDSRRIISLQRPAGENGKPNCRHKQQKVPDPHRLLLVVPCTFRIAHVTAVVSCSLQ